MLLALLAACGTQTEEGVVLHPTKVQVREDKMLRANRYLNMKDMLVIRGYIDRHELKMVQSDLGYFYTPSSVKGMPIKAGNIVLYDYSVSLVDGTPLDSSANGLAQIVVDKSEGITGLHDGLKRLHEGDSATFIFPPHLAYGLIGDGSKIPARATLVYQIMVKSVK